MELGLLVREKYPRLTRDLETDSRGMTRRHMFLRLLPIEVCSGLEMDARGAE
jgi:hypothetical protein